MTKRIFALSACLLGLTACPETKNYINTSFRDWCQNHTYCQSDQADPAPVAPPAPATR